MQEAIDAAEDGETIYVKGNPVVNGGATLTTNKNITIAGHKEANGTFGTIERGNGFKGSLITVSNGSLTLENVTLDGNKVSGGSLVTVSGGSLNVNGGTFTGNTAKNGGAIAVEGNATVTIEGGEIYNNSATGTGNGVYLGGSTHITLDGTSATEGIEDAFGIGASGQISVTGELSHRVNVEFADPETQVGAEGADKVYITSDSNGGQDLKDNFRVTNPGYTFDPNEGETSGELSLIESRSVVAVIKHADGTYTNCTSVQEAVNAAQEGETVLLATYTNKADSSLSATEVVLNETLVIPKDKDIVFGSVNVVASADGQGNMDYEYVESGKEGFTPVTVKRGGSLTEEMIRVEEGGSLTIGSDGAEEDTIIFDGGAVWGTAGKPVVSDDGKGTPGSANTGNTGITAHAPVIVNQGTLVMQDGATIQNNDNNYAAPNEGFGSENYGGGIRNEVAGNFTMNGGSIEDCYSREGGAIINVNKPNQKGDGSYVEPENGVGPTVTMNGGTISGNASQMKGSAIQTIYGGATTVINGGTITANTSLHDYGTLAVEEGGSLEIAGGTANVEGSNSGTAASGGAIADNENLIYIYNKYSEEDIAGAAEGTFVEGNGAAQVHITSGEGSSPELGGNIHLDDPCEVFDKDGVSGGTDYYHPVVDISGYEGEKLTVTVDASRGYGVVVVSDSDADLSGDSAKAEVQIPEYTAPEGYDGTRFTYAEESEGKPALNFGGFDVKIEQTGEDGKVVISGTADPALDGVTVTIGGQEVVLTVDENGDIEQTVALDLAKIGNLTEGLTVTAQAQKGGAAAGDEITITNSLELEKAIAKAEAEKWCEELKTSANSMGLDGSALDKVFEKAVAAIEGAQKGGVATVLGEQKKNLFDALKGAVKQAIEAAAGEAAAGEQPSEAIKEIVNKYVAEGTGIIDGEEDSAGVELEYERALAELTVEQAREEIKGILGEELYGETVIDGQKIDDIITAAIEEIRGEITAEGIKDAVERVLGKVYNNDSIIKGAIDKIKNEYPEIFDGPSTADDITKIEQATEDFNGYPDVVKNSSLGEKFAEELDQMYGAALKDAKEKAVAEYKEAIANAGAAVENNGFGGVPAAEEQQAVIDAIEGATDLTEINAALGEGVKDIIEGLTVAGDSQDTANIAQNGQAAVDSATDSATGAGALADLAQSVTDVANEIKAQRDEEKTAAKQQIAEGLNELYPDGASEGAKELVAAGEAAINGGVYEDYQLIIDKTLAKSELQKHYDEIIADKTINGIKDTAGIDGALENAFAAIDKIEGAATGELEKAVTDGILSLDRAEGAAIVEGYVAAEDGEGAKAVAEAAKEDISAATSATEIEGIVDGAKLDIEKERAEEQIYGFAGENLSAEAEAIIEEYLGEPDGKNHIGGNRKRNARRSR